MEVHRQYNLRSKKNPYTLNTKNSDNPTKNSSKIEPRKTTDSLPKKTVDNSGKKKVEIPIKRVADSVSKTTQINIPTTSQQKEPITKQITEQAEIRNLSKNQTSFNIENELEKFKSPIPLIELMNKSMYRP